MATLASTSILIVSIVATLLTVLLALHVIREKGWWLPWLLLAGTLLLISGRRLASLREFAAATPASFELDRELSMAFAVLLLLGVHTVERLINEVRTLRSEKVESEKTVEGLVANLPVVVSVVDRYRGVRFLNPSSVQPLTGHPAEMADNAGAWLELLHDDDRPGVERALERAFVGETVRLEVRFRHRDASWRWAEIVFYPQRSGGAITAVSTLTSDVTEKRLLEEQLRQAQKMEALGAMGGGMAHDFNNLLASILGNVELAIRKAGPEHAAQKNLSEALRAAQRATDHCRQILGFSRRSVLNPRLINLNEVCREAVGLLRPTVDPAIDFAIRPDGDLWATLGDPSEIVQLLVNLLLNARDVLPNGGQVVLETANVALDGAGARGHPDARPGDYVRLTITDNGPGMSPDIQARIFEPFFTTKATGQGTGLGLAMVYGTAKRHGGWVQCVSELGLGTRFILYFPKGRSPALESADRAEPVRGGKETILLVEDEEALRTVGVEALEDLGYSVLTARDGIEAVEVFSRERDRVRLVILDLSMPRMGGREALPRLKAIDPGARVLVTTGHSPEGEAQAFLAQGAVGFIGKPYRLEEMGRAVRSALDS